MCVSRIARVSAWLSHVRGGECPLGPGQRPARAAPGTGGRGPRGPHRRGRRAVARPRAETLDDFTNLSRPSIYRVFDTTLYIVI